MACFLLNSRGSFSPWVFGAGLLVDVVYPTFQPRAPSRGFPLPGTSCAWPIGGPAPWTIKEDPAKAGPLELSARLVIAHAAVVATPPIGAPGDEGLAMQPPAIVPIGVVIGTVGPDPNAIHECPMTMMKVVKVVATFREAAMLEPFAALYKATTITEREMAAAGAFSKPRATRFGSSESTTNAAALHHCAGMATTAPAAASVACASSESTATVATSTTPAAAFLGHERQHPIAVGIAQARRGSCLSRFPKKRGHKQAARKGNRCSKFRSHQISPSRVGLFTKPEMRNLVAQKVLRKS
jgi:hypothetical protein